MHEYYKKDTLRYSNADVKFVSVCVYVCVCVCVCGLFHKLCPLNVPTDS